MNNNLIIFTFQHTTQFYTIEDWQEREVSGHRVDFIGVESIEEGELLKALDTEGNELLRNHYTHNKESLAIHEAIASGSGACRVTTTLTKAQLKNFYEDQKQNTILYCNTTYDRAVGSVLTPYKLPEGNHEVLIIQRVIAVFKNSVQTFRSQQVDIEHFFRTGLKDVHKQSVNTYNTFSDIKECIKNLVTLSSEKIYVDRLHSLLKFLGEIQQLYSAWHQYPFQQRFPVVLFRHQGMMSSTELTDQP